MFGTLVTAAVSSRIVEDAKLQAERKKLLAERQKKATDAPAETGADAPGE
jgi:hypothetical protein